jgi:hypothetical protein
MMSVENEQYVKDVWQGVESELDGVPEHILTHADPIIRRLADDGVPTGAATRIMLERIQESAHAFGQGMETFQLIGAAIERLGEAIEDRAENVRLMDTMLHLKQGMSVLYHNLAIMAPMAGADFTSPEETARELEAATDELAQWVAKREEYGFTES